MNTKIRIETRSQMERVVKQMKKAAKAVEKSEWRRKHWRLNVDVPGTVEMQENPKTADPLTITTRNISEEGLGFWSDQPIPKGCKILATIETDQGTVEVRGSITHCTGIIGRFMVGVLFDLIEGT